MGVFLPSQTITFTKEGVEATNSGEHMKITLETATEMAVVCATLVREGIMFEASKLSSGVFVIELTGGF